MAALFKLLFEIVCDLNRRFVEGNRVKEFNYLMITNKPDIAAFVEDKGVQRIFVDLEINGKLDRQGHLDTVVSRHSIDDVRAIRKVLTRSELLVRINPFFEGSEAEIEAVIDAGADIIMLPMFKSLHQVESVGKFIDGRVKLIPLVETIEAIQICDELDSLACVDELHIGLNDLHLQMGLNFMFELIQNGYIESYVKSLKKPFGIGGIAKVSEGAVPGELVMAEHIRLGSSGVILSRAFHNDAQSLSELKSVVDFQLEFQKLLNVRKELLNYSEQALENKHEQFCNKVKSFVEKID